MILISLESQFRGQFKQALGDGLKRQRCVFRSAKRDLIGKFWWIGIATELGELIREGLLLNLYESL